MSRDRVIALKAQIADLKERFPAHSVQRAMMMQLDALEEELILELSKGDNKEEGVMPDRVDTGYENRCLISCGMLHPEINYLIKTGFLNRQRTFFTPPGLHAIPERLEEYLHKRLELAREWCSDHEIIVVYGKKCFVSADEPLKRVDTILQEAGQEIIRVQGDYGYDMLAGYEERQRISEGRQEKFLWFTPGWLRSWKTIFQRYFGWDEADANANFPGYYDKIIVLDGLNLADEYMTQHVEEILELFDWTGLEVEFHPITLDHFKGLLMDAFQARKSKITSPLQS